MVDGNRLGEVGFQYLGVSYSQMDCQAFVEQCLRDCGCDKNLAGSNAWYREVMKHGWVGTPEECRKEHGKVPKGAFLFILKQDGKEPEKYKPDGTGNASHIGIVTMPEGDGAIHSSSSRGCVCESKFAGKTISNGGWNRVGLWDQVAYAWDSAQPEPSEDNLPLLRRGDKGEYVTLLQTKLIQRGYDLAPYGADGDFGKKTEAAVKLFQRDWDLKADGIVGPATWGMLNSAPVVGNVFTVTIMGLTRAEAEALADTYPQAIIEEDI